MPYRSKQREFIPIPKNNATNFYFPNVGGGKYKIEGYVGSD